MQTVSLPSSTVGSFGLQAQIGDGARRPAPTTPPNILARAAFGETNCAYLNGNPQLPLNCASGFDCTWDGAASVSGCCATAGGPCNLQTTCIDYAAPPGPPAPPRALTCGEDKPFCTTGIFVDGYAMFTCGSEDKQTQASALYHSTGPAASSGRVASTSAQSLLPSGSSGATHGNTDKENSTNDGSSTPLATVIGAVIGVIAVVLIAVFLVWLALRIRRKDRANQPIPSPPASVIEMVKPSSASDQPVELEIERKKVPTYSEMEVPPLRVAELHTTQKPRPELSGTEFRHAYEMDSTSAANSTSGRSELP